MKKIVLIGPSSIDPKFFNSRVLGIEKNDNYHFGEILGKTLGINDVRIFACSGAGNNWIKSALLNQLDIIDEDTLVVMQWALVDRFDMLLSHEQDMMQQEIETCMDPKFDFLKFNRTFDILGNVTDKGMRYWPSAHFMLGPKMKYKQFLSHLYNVKETYEAMALCQQLIKSKGAQQIHSQCLDTAFYTDRVVKQHMLSNFNRVEATYSVIDVKPHDTDFFERYPEMNNWKKLVDWDMFTENYFDFFKNRNIPYVCPDYKITQHQPPINNYMYIKGAIAKHLDLPTRDILDEIVNATYAHLAKYSCNYPWNNEIIEQVCKSPS